MGDNIRGVGMEKTKVRLADLDLNEKQKQFCREYILDWNATRAYDKVYKPEGKDTAGVNGHMLLKNTKIREYIEYIQNRLEEVSGISRLKVLQEYANIAFSSMGHYHNTWITKEEFENLTDEQKSCIQEISTKVNKIVVNGEQVGEAEFVKIKLYDKQKALESISKMLGYDAVQTINVNHSTKPTIIIGKIEESDDGNIGEV